MKTSEAYAELGAVPAPSTVRLRQPYRAKAKGARPGPAREHPPLPPEPPAWRAALERLYPGNAVNELEKSWAYLVREHPAIAAEVTAAAEKT